MDLRYILKELIKLAVGLDMRVMREGVESRIFPDS